MVRDVIDRYLVKEISLTLATSTSVLVLIIFGNQFVRLLTSATEGQIAVESIMPLLVLGGIESVILLLPVSFLLAVMLKMGGPYRDSEIIGPGAGGIVARGLDRKSTRLNS